MNAERWSVVKELFACASEVPEAERERFLEQECRGNAALLADVRGLLDPAHSPARFLDPAPGAGAGSVARSFGLDFRGCRFGDFELIEELGRGASGVVFLAEQHSLGRKAAVKILSPLLCQSPARLERFQREAASAARLRHPNVVTILGTGTDQGVHWMAMEYVEGRTLHAILEELRNAPECSAFDVRDPERAARIVEVLARALDTCHAAGLVHRDIKPHNILIDTAGEPRIVDFGLVKDLELPSLSETGTLAGTPNYMSPEQALATKGRIDARTDIYSLGAVLYEMLTLELPFAGESAANVLHDIVHVEPRALRRIDPTIPRGIAAIVAKAMRKSQAERYPSAAAMALDLRRFLEGMPTQAPEPSAARETFERVFLRHPWMAAAGALVLFGGLLFFVPKMDIALASSGERSTVSSARHAEFEHYRTARLYIELLRHRVNGSSDPDLKPEERRVLLAEADDLAKILELRNQDPKTALSPKDKLRGDALGAVAFEMIRARTLPEEQSLELYDRIHERLMDLMPTDEEDP